VHANSEKEVCVLYSSSLLFFPKLLVQSLVSLNGAPKIKQLMNIYVTKGLPISYSLPFTAYPYKKAREALLIDST